MLATVKKHAGKNPPVQSERVDETYLDGRIVVGKFGRPRGLDGEIYITPNTDFPERFFDMTELTFQRGHRWWLSPLETIKVEQIEAIGGRPVVKLEGFDSPESVAPLTHGVITVLSTEIAKPPDGHFYLFDLVGCKVVDESGKELGEVEEVERYPANDAYLVRTPLGATVLFPAVTTFVLNIDVAAKIITVKPAGMFDTVAPLHID